MPSFFLIGSCTGDFLNSLKSTLNDQFLPLMTSYFKEPVVKKKAAVKTEKGEPKTDPSDTGALRRPSDYRRMSMTVEKAVDANDKKKLIVGVPSSGSNLDLEDKYKKGGVVSDTPIRDDLLMETLGLEKALIWTIEHVDDDIDLPLANFPPQLHTDQTDEELAKDKKLIVILQDMVMGWERHILKVIEGFLSKVIKFNCLAFIIINFSSVTRRLWSYS